MSFNNNLQRTPTGMPRLMRPKAVSVSPIKSPIGNVIARPVVTLMPPQGQSQYVLGTNAVPQVYQGARLTQTLSSSQPRISAQVIYPQQPRVPVQLAGRVTVTQNRPPGVHSYPAAAFQNRVAYPVQRPATGQVQPNAQVLIPGRVNSANNVHIIKPAVSNIAGQFHAQTQHRYSLPAQVNLGKQFIMTQNRSLIPSQATTNVLSAGRVQRLPNVNSGQIICQNEMPIRVNPSIGINVVSSGTMSYDVHPTLSNVTSSGNTLQISPSNVTVGDGSASSLAQSSTPPQLSNFTTTSLDLPLEDSLKDSASLPSLPFEEANIENMDVSLQNELPVNNSDTEMDAALNSVPNQTVMLFSEGVDINVSVTADVTPISLLGSPVLAPDSDREPVNLFEDSEAHNAERLLADDAIPIQMTDTLSGHIVINPLSEEQSITEMEGDASEELKSKNIGNKSDDTAVSLIASSVVSEIIEKTVETGNKNSVDSITDSTKDNAMETDTHASESENKEAFMNDVEVNQFEIDNNSQESLPSFSEKALSTCQYCSDEDSQFTGVSSDLYTEDSSNMSWEKFHEKVLNLRVNKDRVKTSYSSFEEPQMSSNVNDLVSKSSALTEDVEERYHEDDTECIDDDSEEPYFMWEDYLQQIGATAVPPTAFKHVECSLQSCFIKGMKLEVRNKSDPDTFWVATVMMTCGPLLRLRYDGYGDDNSNDFWCDFSNTEIHHIGWSAQNGKNLQPPDEIRDKVSDWRSFLLESLTGARTAPSSFLEKNSGITPVDQIKFGMMLEIQDILHPLHVWLVQVLENVGGRLYLRLEGTESASKHFWMFYLNPRLHPIGWALEQGDCVYRPPPDIYDEQTDEKWTEILEAAMKGCKEAMVPEDVFKDQSELKNHQFAVGMKVEALNPGLSQIGPATVIEVVNNNYFVVEMDDLRPPEKRRSIKICCNSEYLGIFPVSWCQCKGIRMVPPPGWTNTDFVWGEYLSFCNAKAAPEKLFNSGTDDHDFERGMKLEAVNPSNPNQICAATITKIVGPLLWIHLDHVRDIPSHIEDIDSHNIFPVGWCESNNYQLKPPMKTKLKQKPVPECKTEAVYRSVISSRGKGAWCPKIYFNHRCFSGPYLSKGRISDLPKHVGPGPMDLVLKEVLRLLVSIAYVPCRAMKEIQQDVPPNPHMKSHILKAKYKGKKYKVTVDVCHNETQLEEFCRSICIKLECCPYLFSPLCVSDNCPENCQQLTKTKSNPSYVKKKKVGNILSAAKPHTVDVENREPKKRGRKRKRFLFVQKKGQQGQRNQEAHHDHQRDEGFIDYDDDEGGMVNGDRRNYDIQTRGAKLPKYSFERKTHKKILMSQSNIRVDKHTQGLKKFKQKAWNIDVKDKHALQPREGSIKLDSNPLNWSVAEVVQYIKTTDCSHLARIMKEQEVDGQAFLLMNLSAIQEHLELKLGPAVKLCHQIERLKIAFFENYA